LRPDRERLVQGVHSLAARVGACTASKAALELFTEALHLELMGTDVGGREATRSRSLPPR
jgi:hypothetical protein